MRIRVFYDSSGKIRSVLAASPKAGVTPASSEFSCVEADLEELGAKSLAAVQLGFRVDRQGKITPCDTPARPEAS
ncbi:MAG TPA: hypothetical protein VFZ91_16545 [Allosphingosinicella sp.]